MWQVKYFLSGFSFYVDVYYSVVALITAYTLIYVPLDFCVKY